LRHRTHLEMAPGTHSDFVARENPLLLIGCEHERGYRRIKLRGATVGAESLARSEFLPGVGVFGRDRTRCGLSHRREHGLGGAIDIRDRLALAPVAFDVSGLACKLEETDLAG